LRSNPLARIHLISTRAGIVHARRREARQVAIPLRGFISFQPPGGSGYLLGAKRGVAIPLRGFISFQRGGEVGRVAPATGASSNPLARIHLISTHRFVHRGLRKGLVDRVAIPLRGFISFQRKTLSVVTFWQSSSNPLARIHLISTRSPSRSRRRSPRSNPLARIHLISTSGR